MMKYALLHIAIMYSTMMHCARASRGQTRTASTHGRHLCVRDMLRLQLQHQLQWLQPQLRWLQPQLQQLRPIPSMSAPVTGIYNSNIIIHHLYFTRLQIITNPPFYSRVYWQGSRVKLFQLNKVLSRLPKNPLTELIQISEIFHPKNK